jgi:hypothetical protein
LDDIDGSRAPADGLLDLIEVQMRGDKSGAQVVWNRDFAIDEKVRSRCGRLWILSFAARRESHEKDCNCDEVFLHSVHLNPIDRSLQREFTHQWLLLR